MPSTTLTLVLLAPVLLFTVWYISSTISPPSIPLNLRNKRIILLIAHPDDESMFFSPALQALTAPALGNHVKILCMSTGDADGLGEIRRKELESAALTLGLRQPQDVFVMDDERFRDGMKQEWSHGEIARVLAQAFAPQLIADTASTTSSNSSSSSSSTTARNSTSSSAKDKSARPKSTATTPKPSSKPKFSSRSSTRSTTTTSTTTPSINPTATIDVILTFDSHGISSHPNHIALYHGARLFLTRLTTHHSSPLDLYTLTTINIVRKYSFVFDLIPTYLHRIVLSLTATKRTQNVSVGTQPEGQGREERKDDRRKAGHVVFVSDVSRYLKAREAMVRGHRSQMVWFRWGWIGLGRYMVVNDLKREAV